MSPSSPCRCHSTSVLPSRSIESPRGSACYACPLTFRGGCPQASVRTEPGRLLAFRFMSELLAVVLPRPAAAAEIVRAWEAGRAVLPLDPAAPAPELRAVLDALRPTHLVYRDGVEALPGGEPVEDGVAAVVATSGTTGRPKGVELTAAGIEASSRAVSAALGTGPGDRWLACVGLHSVAGLAIVARAWHGGLPLEVHERFDVDAVAAAAAAGATLVSVVPTMLARLLDAGAGRAGRARRRPRRLGGQDLRPDRDLRWGGARRPSAGGGGAGDRWRRRDHAARPDAAAPLPARSSGDAQGAAGRLAAHRRPRAGPPGRTAGGAGASRRPGDHRRRQRPSRRGRGGAGSPSRGRRRRRRLRAGPRVGAAAGGLRRPAGPPAAADTGRPARLRAGAAGRGQGAA